MGLAVSSPVRFRLDISLDEVQSIEKSLHNFRLRAAKSSQGEVHPAREMTEGTVPLHTVNIAPLPVLPGLHAVLNVPSVRGPGLPEGAGGGLLGVGVHPLPLLPLVSQA